jgi:hypothetical protein
VGSGVCVGIARGQRSVVSFEGVHVAAGGDGQIVDESGIESAIPSEVEDAV